MKRLTIDLKDYSEGGSVFKRTAVRGIVQNDEEYLMIYSKYGDYKFPGGGMKAGESLEQVLLREIQEETGYVVNQESMVEGIHVKEKRKGELEDIMEMDSYYYFCTVYKEKEDRNLDDYEAEYDYKVIWITLEEAIKKNEAVEDGSMVPWLKRETMVMKELNKRQKENRNEC